MIGPLRIPGRGARGLRTNKRGLFRRLRGDRRGVAAVEFALVLPFMVLLFFGMLEMNAALTVDRKVSQAAQSLADLVSQTDRLSSNDINDLLKVTKAVLDPYPQSDLKLVVASVEIEDVNKPRVQWSRAVNEAQWATGSAPPIEFPEALAKQPGSFVIVTQATYKYTPSFSAVLKDVFNTDSIELADTYFMRPRISTSVSCCS